MFLTILFFSGLALFLSIAAWKTSEHNQKLPKALCVVIAIPMVLSCLGLAFGTDPYPGQPKDTVTAFFTAVEEMRHREAAQMMTDGAALDTDHLSDDGQMLVYGLSDNLKATPIGEPNITAFSAVQRVNVECVSLPKLLEELDAGALPLLKPMMLTREKSELFTADGSDYLPAIKDEVYRSCFLPLTDSMTDYTVTKVVEVQLRWTPFGWKIIPDHNLLSVLTGCLHITDSPSYAAMDRALEQTKQQFFHNLPRLNKIYILDENITKGPAPDPDGFHSTTDPNEVVAVIEQAAVLLDGQTVSWSPDLELMPDSVIRYYYDHSILVIVWQEVRDNCVVTFTEVKVAHPTQLFRAMCGDRYQPTVNNYFWEKPTTLARRSNAVVAVTGDFYRHREIGSVVYQRRVYRNEPALLDSLFFDANGDMIMVKQRTLTHKTLLQFVADNDIRFGFSFGPILIQDGKKARIGMYTVGEGLERYDRCAVGQVDDLHYVIVNANFTRKHRSAPLLIQAQTYLYEKGCVQGYALDGGQTGSLVFNGELINQVNYGGERTSSDMLCFVSGIPESDR